MAMCLQAQSSEGAGLDAGKSGGGGARQGRGDEGQEETGTRHQRSRGSTRHSQPRTSGRREEHQEVPTTDQRTTTTGYCRHIMMIIMNFNDKEKPTRDNDSTEIPMNRLL